MSASEQSFGAWRSQSPLFHILEQSTWKQATFDGMYQATSLATEGFIHLSTANQVLTTANRFYRGQSGLVLLEIDSDRLHAELRYEDVPDHGRFPHLYGPLNLDAVVQVWPFEPTASGEFVGWGDRPGSHPPQIQVMA